MTDKELLELAAKAAGMDVCCVSSDGVHRYDTEVIWNPFIYYCDALRLAVKLHMTVRCYMGTTCVQIGVPGQANAYVEETNYDDPAVATSRAIVRAAAEIGKALK